MPRGLRTGWKMARRYLLGSSHGRRGEVSGGKVTIISRGVEISIAGGGGEMVSRPISWSFFSLLFLLFFCNHALFVSRSKKPYAA